MSEICHNGKIGKTDEQKVEMFGEAMQELFTEQPDPLFNQQHFDHITEFVKENREQLFRTKPADIDLDSEFTLEKLKIT